MPINKQKIKQLIKRNDLTYKEFAKEIGVTEPTIINWLKGHVKISIDALEKIAHYFSVPVSYFFDEGAGINVNNSANGVGNHVNITIDRQQHEIARLKEKVEALQNQLSEKDKRINTLEHLIKVLEEKCK